MPPGCMSSLDLFELIQEPMNNTNGYVHGTTASSRPSTLPPLLKSKEEGVAARVETRATNVWFG